MACLPLFSDKHLIWSKLSNLTHEQKQFMQDASDHGLVDGITFPLYGPNSKLFICSFASTELFQRDITPFRNLAACFHQGVLQSLSGDAGHEVMNLNERQIEILEMYSKGLSYAQIGDEIGITPASITGHFNKIKKVLNVGSNIQAVTVAMQRGVLGNVKDQQ